MGFFERVDVIKVNVLYANHSSVFLKSRHYFIRASFVVKYQIPRQLLSFGLPIVSQPNMRIKLNTDRQVPFERLSIEFDPHVLKCLGALRQICRDEFVEKCLNFFQADGQIIEPGKHHIQTPRILIGRNISMIQSNFDRDLALPNLSPELVIDSVIVYSVLSFTKVRMFKCFLFYIRDSGLFQLIAFNLISIHFINLIKL